VRDGRGGGQSSLIVRLCPLKWKKDHFEKSIESRQGKVGPPIPTSDPPPTIPCRDSHRNSTCSESQTNTQSESVKGDCPPLLPPLTTFQSYPDLQNFCAISVSVIDPDPNNQPSSNQDRPRSNKIYRISKFSSAGIQVFAPSRNREIRKHVRDETSTSLVLSYLAKSSAMKKNESDLFDLEKVGPTSST
jgi:hypothetical protein